MIKSKKRLIYIFIFFIIISLLPVASKAVKIGDAFKQPLEDVGGESGAGFRSNVEPESVIGKVIQIALSFIGVIVLVLLIYGGYLWMMARGNDQAVEKAKNLITAAIIGLIIVLTAYGVSYFILERVSRETMQ